MTLALPSGRPHSDPRCPHLAHARRHRVAQVRLIDDGPVCRDCLRREVRRRRVERQAADDAIRAAAREEAARDPQGVVEYVCAKARGDA